MLFREMRDKTIEISQGSLGSLQQSKHKIRRRKGVPTVPPLRELRTIRISYLITNSVRKMKVLHVYTLNHL